MDPEQPYLVTEAMILTRSWHRRQMPKYKVDEVAKVFFAMSASWLRLKMNPDPDHPETWFVKDGKRMVFRRADPDKTDSARVFVLSDIEPMARSLYTFGAIDAAKLAKVLDIVAAEATLYGLFDKPEDDPADEEDGEEAAEPAAAGS